MIRRRNLWRAVRTHPSAFNMRTSSERGSLHIVQLPLEPAVVCPCVSNPSCDLWLNVGACVNKAAQKQNCVACLYLWPAASMTSGEVRSAWFGVRSSIGLRLVLGHGEACCFENDHDDGHHLGKAFRRLKTISASSAYNMPQTFLHTHFSGHAFTPTPSSQDPPRGEPNPLKCLDLH